MRRGSNDLLETSAIGCYGKGVQGWTVRKSVCARMGMQLVMNLTESCLRRREARLTSEQLLGGFSSSHWWAFAALWWPHSPDSKEQRGGGEAEGSGQWFILPPCQSLWATPLEMASNVTVLRRKISALPKCYSSSDGLTHLMCAPPGTVCFHQPDSTI